VIPQRSRSGFRTIANDRKFIPQQWGVIVLQRLQSIHSPIANLFHSSSPAIAKHSFTDRKVISQQFSGDCKAFIHRSQSDFTAVLRRLQSIHSPIAK
jgi:hypothetical protein